MKKFLLDSNTVIDYIGGILPVKSIGWLDQIIETEAAISVFNRIEVLSFNPKNQADLIPFEELVETVEVIALSEEIILQTILIRRNYKLKLPDAMVAATAIVFDMAVVTRNEADFKKVVGLKIVNPHAI